MSGTAHKIRFSSGYCFGPNNRNGVFTPSNNDPFNLRQHLNIALSSTMPAYFANPPPEPVSCEDIVVPDTCNLARLADIITLPLPSPPNCISAFDTFYTNLFAACPNNILASIEEHLFCVMVTLSNYAFIYAASADTPCDPATEPFEIVVIFDDKLAVSWGALTDNGTPGGNLYRSIAPMPFPLNFSTFEVTMYKVATKTHYSDPRGVYPA